MITRNQVTRFTTEDGIEHAAIEAAQEHELALLSKDTTGMESSGNDLKGVVSWIVTNRDRVVDILTTSMTSKNKARRVNGGAKKRKATVAPVTPVTPKA